MLKAGLPAFNLPPLPLVSAPEASLLYVDRGTAGNTVRRGECSRRSEPLGARLAAVPQGDALACWRPGCLMLLPGAAHSLADAAWDAPPRLACGTAGRRFELFDARMLL